VSRALRSLVLVASLIVVGGCGSDPVVAPDARVVSVTTTACGDTSKTSASGVVIEEGRVLTVAHAVIGAGAVSIADAAGDTAPAAIVRLDPTRDLAVLAVDELTGSPVRFATLKAGDRAVVASATSGDLEAEVTSVATLEIDEVRGTARHRRSGYELSGPVAVGDSGAGVFDDDRLAGLVFAISNERDDVGFAVDADEIGRFLDDGADREYRCEPAQSIVTAVAPTS
jgi:S1-C subfamily serine protease